MLGNRPLCDGPLGQSPPALAGDAKSFTDLLGVLAAKPANVVPGLRQPGALPPPETPPPGLQLLSVP